MSWGANCIYKKTIIQLSLNNKTFQYKLMPVMRNPAIQILETAHFILQCGFFTLRFSHHKVWKQELAAWERKETAFSGPHIVLLILLCKEVCLHSHISIKRLSEVCHTALKTLECVTVGARNQRWPNTNKTLCLLGSWFYNTNK